MTPADFDRRITFKEFEGHNFSEEQSLRTLLLRHYTKFFSIEESEDYANRYIAKMCEESK